MSDPATETVPTEAPTAPVPDEDATGTQEEGEQAGTDDGDTSQPTTPPASAPDEGTGDEQPDEPDEGSSAPSTEATLEALDRRATQLSRRGGNYRDAVIEYLQETQQPLVQCGFCLTDLPGFFPSPAVQPFTPDQLSFARAVLGQPDEPPLIQANDAKMCPACDGWGQVLTGAKRNDQKTRKCLTCNGLGWEGRGAGEAAPTNGAANLTIVQPEQAPPDVPDRDPWGRPAGHPGFNQLPSPGMPEYLLPPGMHTVNPI